MLRRRSQGAKAVLAMIVWRIRRTIDLTMAFVIDYRNGADKFALSIREVLGFLPLVTVIDPVPSFCGGIPRG